MYYYTTIIISILVIIFLLYTQLKVRKVSNEKNTIPIITLLLGTFILKLNYVPNNFSTISLILIAVSFTIVALVTAGVRASTIKQWKDKGVVYSQGTWLTIQLWILSLMLHIALNQKGHVGLSTLLIFYSITYIVQKSIIQYRAEHMPKYSR